MDLGHIYDRDLESMRVGDTVDLTNASFRETFHGMVTYNGELLDPATHTTLVRIVAKIAGAAHEGHVRGRGDSYPLRPGGVDGADVGDSAH